MVRSSHLMTCCAAGSEAAAHLCAPGGGDGALDGGFDFEEVPVLALPDGAVGVFDAVDDDLLGVGGAGLAPEAPGADDVARARDAEGDYVLLLTRLYPHAAEELPARDVRGVRSLRELILPEQNLHG